MTRDLTDEQLREMDEQADDVIRNWSFGALVGNLLPPPFDAIVVAGVFARMGQRLAEVYKTEITWSELKGLGKGIAKGIGAVAFAASIGTGIFKWVPGVNVWVALLVQPPIVAAITHSAGNAFKQYFQVRITEGKKLTPEQIRELASAQLSEKLS